MHACTFISDIKAAAKDLGSDSSHVRFVCMYVRVYARMYVCMYVLMYVSHSVTFMRQRKSSISMPVMYVFVRVYVIMYVCKCVCK